jgi:uncharacterized membrane protein YhhN
MWKRHLSFSISFGFIAVLYLIIEGFAISQGRIIIKPLICLILAGYLLSNTRLGGNFSKLIFAGLLFSLVGDIALIFAGKGGTCFLVGLGAFLCAHLCYALAFFRDYKYNPEASKKIGHAMVVIMAVFTLGFYLWLSPYLNEMKMPVLAYMIIISLMATMAAYRYGRVKMPSFQLIFAGAIFFVISDSLLAINLFVQPFQLSGIFIMATYMLAQYLITMGTLGRVVSVKSKMYS